MLNPHFFSIFSTNFWGVNFPTSIVYFSVTGISLNWGNWNSEFVKLVVRWAEQDTRHYIKIMNCYDNSLLLIMMKTKLEIQWIKLFVDMYFSSNQKEMHFVSPQFHNFNWGHFDSWNSSQLMHLFWNWQKLLLSTKCFQWMNQFWSSA